MNPKIRSIAEDMKNRSPKNPIATSDIQTYLSVQSSELLVLLAEEAEIQNSKTTEQTEKVIRFTKAIHGLTWALLFIGVVQITMMVVNSITN